jgi:hypothetical protein
MLLFRASNLVSQTASDMRRVARHVLWLWVCGCSVYDSELLQSVNSLSGTGMERTRDNPVITNSTSARDSGFELGPDETALPRRGSDDVDDAGVNVVRCGDGQVSGVEKCDTAIEAGRPGACPTECPELARCVPRLLNGTACQTECVLRTLTCQGGDGCCPGNCNKDNDQDCSARCGDGIVQTTETCEPETATPCITGEAACDDDDACTVDRITGSASNCNVACTHEPIEAPDPSDGCCPRGANARNDPDCEPACGNGVKEDGEDCDGSDDCDPECKFINAGEIMRCTEQAKNDCERCACAKCTATELACRGGPNENENRLCGAIIDCSSANNCIGTPCFCGASVTCAPPLGPCRGEIEAAGGSALQVAAQVGDPATTVGRSYAADQCRVAQCQAECR